MSRRRSAAQLTREIAEVLGERPRRQRAERRRRDQWRGSEVQTLLFARPRWRPSSARAWAREHGYREGKVHATENYLRLRQFSPSPGAEKRTITFGNGIRAVIEEVK